MKPPVAWIATFTRRWHAGGSSAWLAHTGDTVAAHSGRMGALALAIWGVDGCSNQLLAAIFAHDLGETVAGDVPYDGKRDASIKTAHDDVEFRALSAMGMHIELTPIDEARLKFLDRLDAYLWASHHSPQIMARKDWSAALAEILEMKDAVDAKW